MAVSTSLPVASTTDEAAELATLPAVPGVDIQIGLRSVRGHVARYKRLLHSFAERHADDVARVREELAVGDNTTARRSAHTLKGAAAVLGLTRLQAAAGDLEHAIAAAAEPGAIDALTGATALALFDALQCIAAMPDVVVSDATAPADGAPDWPAARLAIERLETLLADDDAGALSHFNAQSTLLRAALGTRVTAIERCIMDFDFVEAHRLLHEARGDDPRLAAD